MFYVRYYFSHEALPSVDTLSSQLFGVERFKIMFPVAFFSGDKKSLWTVVIEFLFAGITPVTMLLSLFVPSLKLMEKST